MTYRKIDIYLKNPRGGYTYGCSTTRSKTCKEAKRRFLEVHNYLHPDQVRARFANN